MMNFHSRAILSRKAGPACERLGETQQQSADNNLSIGDFPKASRPPEKIHIPCKLTWNVCCCGSLCRPLYTALEFKRKATTFYVISIWEKKKWAREFHVLFCFKKGYFWSVYPPPTRSPSPE